MDSLSVSTIRNIIDPLLLKLREELMGSGVSFGTIAPAALPPTVVYTTNITQVLEENNLDPGIITAQSGVIVGTDQTMLNFIGDGINVTSSGNMTTVDLGNLSVPRQIAWYEDEVVTTGTAKGPLRRIDEDVALVECVIYVKTAPTGASLIVDIQKSSTPNGTYTSLFSGSTPTISAGNYDGIVTIAGFAVTTLSAGTYLRMDVTQVGSTVAGSSLTVDLNMLRL